MNNEKQMMSAVGDNWLEGMWTEYYTYKIPAQKKHHKKKKLDANFINVHLIRQTFLTASQMTPEELTLAARMAPFMDDAGLVAMLTPPERKAVQTGFQRVY